MACSFEMPTRLPPADALHFANNAGFKEALKALKLTVGCIATYSDATPTVTTQTYTPVNTFVYLHAYTDNNSLELISFTYGMHMPSDRYHEWDVTYNDRSLWTPKSLIELTFEAGGCPTKIAPRFTPRLETKETEKHIKNSKGLRSTEPIVPCRPNDFRTKQKCRKFANIVSQNVQGCKRPVKLELIVSRMREKNIKCHFAQEIWTLGDLENQIDEYTMIHHNMKEKDNKGRVKRGVAIFLNEEFAETHKRAGAPKPLTTSKGEF